MNLDNRQFPLSSSSPGNFGEFLLNSSQQNGFFRKLDSSESSILRLSHCPLAMANRVRFFVQYASCISCVRRQSNICIEQESNHDLYLCLYSMVFCSWVFTLPPKIAYLNLKRISQRIKNPSFSPETIKLSGTFWTALMTFSFLRRWLFKEARSTKIMETNDEYAMECKLEKKAVKSCKRLLRNVNWLCEDQIFTKVVYHPN